MSLYSTFGVDQSENWVSVPDDNDVDVRFKLAFVNGPNSEYGKELEKAVRPHRRKHLRKGQPAIDPDVLKGILVDVFARTILLDWENVCDRQGNPVPYTHENAVRLLTELPVLYDILQIEASEISNFQSEALKDEAKNS